MNALHLALLCLSAVLPLAAGLATGAPPQSCATMEPQHGSLPADDPCPFQTVLQQTEMFSNQSLKITLQSTSASWTFRGFLVMGFDSASDRVVGTFEQPTGTDLYQVLDCLGQYEIAATHTSDVKKSGIDLMWKPPPGFDGYVTFYTTFAASQDPYWVKVPSISSVRVMPVADEVTTPLPNASTTPPPLLPDVYDGCGTRKGCFALPGSECIDSRSCTLLVTYRPSASPAGLYDIEIYGRDIKADHYVAVGFSSDKKMGGDSVIQCVIYRNRVDAYNSYNAKENNIRSNVNGFQVISGVYSDGQLYCHVQQPASYSVSDLSVDLSGQLYYFLMAVGPTGANQIQVHDTVWRSDEAISLKALTVVGGYSGLSDLKMVHGSLMILAWLVAASIGVLMPRYMKKSFRGRRVMGKDLWFVIHQGLMGTAWLLTAIAFIIIFVEVDGWAGSDAHPIIGCITTGLAFIQPFMAAVRPEPTAPNRYIFNWAHSLVGYSAHILAITCIFLAVEMPAAQLPFETYWVLTAHIVSYVIAHLCLTVLARSDGAGMAKKNAAKRAVVAAFSLIAFGLAITVIVFITT